jgi:hypothetical protein
MRKQFSLEWEIIPADQVYRAFYRNPKGHVEAGLSESLNAYFNQLGPEEFVTDYISPDKSTAYTYVIRGYCGRVIMELSAEEQQSQVIQKVWMNADAEEAVVVVYTNTDGDVVMQAAKGCKLEVISTLSKGGDFKCYAGSGEHNLTGRSLKAMIVVDEPGLIRPHVSFYRQQPSVVDYVRDYTRIDSSLGVVITDNDDCWREIKATDDTYTIDNPNDIIFFGYKSEDADGNVNYSGNRL